MPSFEWSLLEAAAARLSELQSRLCAAEATHNLGVVKMVEREIAEAEKQREQLMARLAEHIGR